MIKELIPVIGTAVLLAGCNGGESQTDNDAVEEGEQQPGGNESEQFIANSNKACSIKCGEIACVY
ncbi:hypothetical protein I7Z51_004578 [Vibrio parahaemolyticus]|uniref:hypothetical protein n=1 Tax=Vibrio TaxID=662 RepID=UPI001A8D7B45|nr:MULTISPECIES: hypothetical protein [Vibrio]EGQ7975596.1 hypothetical protein [Vibrio parahaemolyticus]MBO0211161.1 hypothetical protein [Vibrio sp. Vb0877]MCR9808273.1 hypothetical protein [Vibrio parahaemolyticus]